MNRLAFSQRLELRQSQALVMTPQLQQAIKMLQLSNLELAEFIEGEIEQNPLLDHAPREAEETPAAAEANGAAAEDGVLLDLPGRIAVEVAAEAAEHWRAAAGGEGDGTHDAGGESLHWQSRGSGFDGDEAAGIERAASRPHT